MPRAISVAYILLGLSASTTGAVGRDDARPSVEGSPPPAAEEAPGPFDNVTALKAQVAAAELDAATLAAVLAAGNEEGRYSDVAAVAEVALGTPAAVIAAEEAGRAAAARAEERRTGRAAEPVESSRKFYEGLPSYRENARVWNEAGVAYYRLGRTADAKECFDAALSRDAAYDEPHANLGLLYRRKGWYDKAVAAYDAALALRPTNPTVWYNRAVALFRLGRFEDAVSSLETASKFGPKYRPPLRRLALIWYDLGDYKTAYGYAQRLSYLVKTDDAASQQEYDDAEEILTLCQNRLEGKKAEPALTVEGSAARPPAPKPAGGK